MDHPEGAGSQRADRVDFDRRVRVKIRGAQISSDGGLLVMRELDDALGLSDLATTALRDTRRGKNTIHRLDALFRQSVFGRLAGYEDAPYQPFALSFRYLSSCYLPFARSLRDLSARCRKYPRT